MFAFFLCFFFFSPENQASVNITNKVGVTPLHDAVTRGDLGIVRILLQHGATTDIKAKDGCVDSHHLLLRSSRKNPYPPHERPLEITRGRGFLKAKLLESKYEAKLELARGRKGAKRKPSVGGVWTFSGTAQLKCLIHLWF